MKVSYKKTILDKLYEKKLEAERSRKKIDYFLLTPEEWGELHAVSRHELTSTYSLCSWDKPYPTEAVELGRGFRRARFIFEHYTVFGERIVVAPAEFH
jgi:hypothetical protein